MLFSLLLFHKPYRVLEIPIKSGHLDVEFCDSCDEEDTASVLAIFNPDNRLSRNWEWVLGRIECREPHNASLRADVSFVALGVQQRK